MRSLYIFATVVLIIASSMLSGCTALFCKAKQKVVFTNPNKGSSIHFRGDSVGTDMAKIQLNKWRVYYTVSVEKEGYKTRNYGLQLSRPGGGMAFYAIDLILPTIFWYGMSVEEEGPIFTTRHTAGTVGLALGSTLGGGLLWSALASPKVHRFKKHQTLPELIPYEKRADNEKYILANNASIDVKSEDVRIYSYKRIRQLNAFEGHTSTRKGLKISENNLKIEQTIFTHSLNRSLYKMNFIDTANSVFTDANNSLYLNATIKNISFHVVENKYKNTRHQKNKLVCVELGINWDLLDYYKQKIDSFRTDKRSDLFMIEAGDNDAEVGAVIRKAIQDNLEYALMALRTELKEKGMLKMEGGSVKAKDTTSMISIAKPEQSGKRFNDFIKSSVTVNTEDHFGSGVVLSADGYLITAYHTVAGAKKIEVTLDDSTKVIAELVRKNTEGDVALLKIAKTGLNPLVFSQESEPEIGGEVWAVGTPRQSELGHTLSKGVISGIRNVHNNTLLQTDAGVNPGYSGGPLINKQGVVLGIITSKINEQGVNGLGFALTAKSALEKLGVRYK